MPGVNLGLQMEDDYLQQRYAKNMPKICHRYAKDNYLMQALSCQRYIKNFVRDMPKICHRHTKDMHSLSCQKYDIKEFVRDMPKIC